MATGNTNDELLQLPYPLAEDPVNVHGDIKQLVDRLKIVLPPLGVSAFQIPVTNSESFSISAGSPVYASGHDGTRTTISPAIATTTNPILGLVKSTIGAGADGIVVVAGVLEDINTSNHEAGDILYVGELGGLTHTRPDGGSGAVGIVAHAAELGVIIVEAKGNGTWGALKAGLA
jgi:hypothetical protein